MATRNSRDGDVLNILGTTQTTDGRGRIERRSMPARRVGVERLRAIGAALGWSEDEIERAIAVGLRDGTWTDEQG